MGIRHIGFLCMLLLVSAVSHAGKEIQEFNVMGEGATYAAALENALVRGVSQVYGAKIKSRQVHETKVRELSKHINDQFHSAGEIDIEKRGRIDFKTEGFVESYEVLSKSINASGLHEVHVLVRISEYKTPGISPHTRRKMAVIPFRTTRSSFSVRAVQVPAEEVSRQLTQRLIAELTQTRRFTVLDRGYEEEFLREKHLILSADVPIEEQMKLGQVLGTDYLLVGTIDGAHIEEKEYTIQVSGESGYEISASFDAEYRILAMATRQIKWAGNVSLSLNQDEIESMISESGTDQILQVLIRTVAKQIVNGALDNIYPIRVVQVQPRGTLLLNQGGESLEVGSLLEVFSAGKRVKDPYSGESLGEVETWVGTVEITRVNPKMSYGEILKGDIRGISKGDICRRIKEDRGPGQRSSPERKKSSVKIGEKGGVRLPFD